MTESPPVLAVVTFLKNSKEQGKLEEEPTSGSYFLGTDYVLVADQATRVCRLSDLPPLRPFLEARDTRITFEASSSRSIWVTTTFRLRLVAGEGGGVRSRVLVGPREYEVFAPAVVSYDPSRAQFACRIRKVEKIELGGRVSFPHHALRLEFFIQRNDREVVLCVLYLIVETGELG